MWDKITYLLGTWAWVCKGQVICEQRYFYSAEPEWPNGLLHVMSAFAFTLNIKNGFLGNKWPCLHLMFVFSRSDCKEKNTNADVMCKPAFIVLCCGMGGHGFWTRTNACRHMICKYVDQKISTGMLISKQSAGVALEVNLRITQARKYARDPPWLWNPGQTSPKGYFYYFLMCRYDIFYWLGVWPALGHVNTSW